MHSDPDQIGQDLMLFNSDQFLFLFFPAALLAFHLLRRFGQRAQIVAILISSSVFYACWNVKFLLLLGGSILLNFQIGRVRNRR